MNRSWRAGLREVLLIFVGIRNKHDGVIREIMS